MDLLSQPNLQLAFGCDHAGFSLKSAILDYLLTINVNFADFGTFSDTSVDYPDFAVKVARSVADGKQTAGILVCGTGLGMSIVANKIKGIRAALCTTPIQAEFSRRHNDANILCLGARILNPDEAKNFVDIWLKTAFEGGRHADRLNKIIE